MKKKKKTLFGLDRVPTLEELRAYFKENDFSAATYIDFDYDKMDSESVEALEYIKGLMDEKWEPLSREMGLKSDSSYYGKARRSRRSPTPSVTKLTAPSPSGCKSSKRYLKTAISK